MANSIMPFLINGKQWILDMKILIIIIKMGIINIINTIYSAIEITR
ncbi:MAG: hypothetical protein GX247_05890 [Mollicutes bacterium]|nr:hypothetical protein [Mollicutes bacterium]